MPSHCTVMQITIHCWVFHTLFLIVPHFCAINIHKNTVMQRSDEMEGYWQKHGAPLSPFALYHTGGTSSSYALPASLLFNTVSFVKYQTRNSTHCPRICRGRSLPRWCSGCWPILSWINTGAICRLADTKMFVFQGDPPPSLYSSWPLPSQNAKGKRQLKLSTATSYCDLQC